MPIDNATVRPYSAEQDPGNPTSPSPRWAKISLAVLGALIPALSGLLALNLLPPDSPWMKLLAWAIGVLVSAVAVITFIVGETRKEVGAIESAKEIAKAKVQGEADVRVAQAEASAPKSKPAGFTAEGGAVLVGIETEPVDRVRGAVGFKP